jgi:type II secretory pathway pseudopilin PulG
VTEGKVRLIEVLSVLTIIGVITVIAVPKYADLQRRDTAQRVLDDIEILREAVYGFYSDSAYFPPESTNELPPESLTPYLPRGFSFTRPYGTIQYKNWPVAVRYQGTGASNVVGATVTTRDPRIGATAGALAPGAPQFTVGDKQTFLFFGS